MPTMCGDGGGFGTGTRGDLQRQDCTLWRVLLLLHVEVLAKIPLQNGPGGLAGGFVPTRAVPAVILQVTFSDPQVESRGKVLGFPGQAALR